MTTYPNLKIEPKLLKNKPRDDEIINLKYRSEKHDNEKILKSLKTDNEYYRKIDKNLNKKKVIMIVTEILIESIGLGVGNGLTISRIARVDITCTCSISFLSSVSTLITNDVFQN